MLHSCLSYQSMIRSCSGKAAGTEAVRDVLRICLRISLERIRPCRGRGTPCLYRAMTGYGPSTRVRSFVIAYNDMGASSASSGKETRRRGLQPGIYELRRSVSLRSEALARNALSAREAARSGLGHKEQLPPPRLSDCCRFGQETFAGAHGNGRDAPISAVRHGAIKREIDRNRRRC